MATNKLIKSLGKKFSFTIANASAAAVVIALLAACFDTATVSAAGTPVAYSLTQNNITNINAAGFAVDAVLDDGITITNVTCTAADSKFSIREFREYVKMQGLTLSNMIIQASNEDCFNGVIGVSQWNPLQGTARDTIVLSSFKSVDQTSDTKIEIRDMQLPLDFETVMTIAVPAGRTMSFIMFFE